MLRAGTDVATAATVATATVVDVGSGIKGDLSFCDSVGNVIVKGVKEVQELPDQEGDQTKGGVFQTHSIDPITKGPLWLDGSHLPPGELPEVNRKDNPVQRYVNDQGKGRNEVAEVPNRLWQGNPLVLNPDDIQDEQKQWELEEKPGQNQDRHRALPFWWSFSKPSESCV
jgi:hypothetical protein